MTRMTSVVAPKPEGWDERLNKTRPHYLVTNFDLPRQGFMTAAWEDEMARRFFEYTVPSVLAQTSRNFVWMVGMSDGQGAGSERADKSLMEAAAKYGVRLAVFDPLAFNEEGWGLTLWDDWIWNREDSAPVPDVVITTALPAGCALHPKFMAQVQSKAEGVNDTRLIICRGGYACDKDGLSARLVEMGRGNPFPTIIDPFTRNHPPLTAADNSIYDEVDRGNFRIDAMNSKEAWVFVQSQAPRNGHEALIPWSNYGQRSDGAGGSAEGQKEETADDGANADGVQAP